MTTIPACKSLGRHCRSLRLTLRIADLPEDNARFRDGIGTWLMGHTQRIDFAEPRIAGRRMLVDAVVHVPCRYFEEGAQGAGCRVHGFKGSVPEPRRPALPVFHENGTVRLVQGGRVRAIEKHQRQAPRRALPTISENPCAGARCRTADNTQGAACCRDLTLDVVLPAWKTHEEDLLTARRSPYLCKVTRMSEDIVECEAISACGYLDDDGVSCTLHDLVRPDGESAKPSVCFEWPDLGPDDTGHPGCRLVPLPAPRSPLPV